MSDRVRRALQIAGLKFVEARCEALRSEVCLLRLQLEGGQVSEAEADEMLSRMGLLEWVYPEFMQLTQDDAEISSD